jgi:hypothetical protein
MERYERTAESGKGIWWGGGRVGGELVLGMERWKEMEMEMNYSEKELGRK